MWELEQAAKMTKEIIEGKIKIKINEETWNKFVNEYKDKKKKLINFLDPKTGRLEINFKRTLKVRAFQYIWNKNIPYSLVDYRSLGCLVTLEELESESIGQNSLIYQKYNKRGKLTRVLSSILHKSGLNTNIISDIISKTWEEFQNSVESKIVISSNILDLAFPSNFSSFKTCYNVDSCHYTSPLSFICNENTIIIYTYSKVSNLPVKTWRVLVHCDQQAPGAIFMREYGYFGNSKNTKNIGKIHLLQTINNIISMLLNINKPQTIRYGLGKVNNSQLVYKTRNKYHTLLVTRDNSLWLDKPTKIIIQDNLPSIKLDYIMPCLKCGNRREEKLWCNKCYLDNK